MKATTNLKFLAAMFAGSMLSLAATYVQAATIDLTPAGSTANFSTDSTGGAATFQNPTSLSSIVSGTGVFNPFLTVQANKEESGFSTDNDSKLPLDTKRSNWLSLLQKSRFARDFLQREAKVEGAGGHFWHDEALTQTPQRPRNGCYPTPSDPATLECGPA